jgi:hypothetical protein
VGGQALHVFPGDRVLAEPVPLAANQCADDRPNQEALRAAEHGQEAATQHAKPHVLNMPADSEKVTPPFAINLNQSLCDNLVRLLKCAHLLITVRRSCPLPSGKDKGDDTAHTPAPF